MEMFSELQTMFWNQQFQYQPSFKDYIKQCLPNKLV